MTRFIHERRGWPSFRWDEAVLARRLAPVRHRQGWLIVSVVCSPVRDFGFDPGPGEQRVELGSPRANETCATFPVEISGQQGSDDDRSTAQSPGA